MAAAVVGRRLRPSSVPSIRRRTPPGSVAAATARCRTKLFGVQDNRRMAWAAARRRSRLRALPAYCRSATSTQHRPWRRCRCSACPGRALWPGRRSPRRLQVSGCRGPGQMEEPPAARGTEQARGHCSAALPVRRPLAWPRAGLSSSRLASAEQVQLARRRRARLVSYSQRRRRRRLQTERVALKACSSRSTTAGSPARLGFSTPGQW